MKKKRKVAKKAASKARGDLIVDDDDADSPVKLDVTLDEEGQRKKEAVLEAL